MLENTRASLRQHIVKQQQKTQQNKTKKKQLKINSYGWESSSSDFSNVCTPQGKSRILADNAQTLHQSLYDYLNFFYLKNKERKKERKKQFSVQPTVESSVRVCAD